MKIDERGFFVFTCIFLLLFFSVGKAEAQTTCPTDPVGIVGYDVTAPDIQTAYDHASFTLGLSDFTLRLAGQVFDENLTLHGGAVEFDGGYACDLLNKADPPSPTSFLGTITIRSSGALVSTVNTESLKVTTTGQCAFDNDNDGFTSIGSCSGSAFDCDDNNPNTYPNAPEICDGLDNDCDDLVDEGLPLVDADGDGYFSAGSCGAVSIDCNDNDPAINPGVEEIAYDGIDQDCSGSDLTYDDGASCQACHHPAPEGMGFLHERNLAPNVTCSLCHATTVDNFLAGHYGQTVRTAGNNMSVGAPINCDSCHDADVNNHSGGIVLGNGSNFVTGKIVADYPNLTCDTCHESRATLHLTATAHDNRFIDGFCGGCHTSDNAVIGLPGNGTLASSADVDSLHGVVSTAGCTLCHDYAGTRLDAAVVRQTIELGLNGTLVSCTNCHTAQSSNHYQDFMHSVAQGPNDLSFDAPGQLCSDCHAAANWAQIDNIEHNVSTNGADSCSTCHNSPRQEVIDAIAQVGTLTHCLDCHSDLYLTRHVDHVALGYVTGGATPCLNCHYLGAVNNGTVTGAHLNNCLLCHTDTTNLTLLPGVPVGGGDCVTCHTGSWEVEHTPAIDHTAIVKVGTTDCASCHTDTLVSGATETHNACGSCHNADGFLIGSAVGTSLATDGDCTTCHGSTWNTLHPTTTTDHSGLVTVATTSCADCHTDTLVSGAAETHNACTSCHDANTGALIGSAINQTGSGDCTTCHSGTWDALHPTTTTDHSVLVTVGASSCAACHDDTLVSAAADTHNACTSCHDAATGALIGSAVGNPAPTDCSTCHTGTWEALHPTTVTDHSGIVTVGATDCASCHSDTLVSAAAETHNACASCHDAATGALIGSAIDQTGSGDCITCHGGAFDTLHAGYTHTVSQSAADLSYDPPGQLCSDCHVVSTWAEINDTEHNVATNGAGPCATCHDSTRQEVIDAIGAGVDPTICIDCHSNKLMTVHGNEDHSALGYVTFGATSCQTCHDPGVSSDGTVTVIHLGTCAHCHTSAPTLQAGIPDGGGDCAVCHTGTWDVEHTPAIDHTALVTVGTTSCADCHTDTLVSAAAETHNACGSCHDGDGGLISTAIGTNFTDGGDCATCHTGTWEALHPTTVTDHSGIVTVAATGCADCHTDTLVSAATETHNACGSCHDANTGALIGSAVGQTGSGDCTTCHTNTWDTDHSTTAFDHSALVTVASTSCASCHSDTLVSAAAETHNACVSCHDSNTGVLIGSAIGQTGSGNCATCHTGSWETLHPTTVTDHSGIVTVGATDCASCHDNTLVSAAPETHDACISCHDAASGALIGSAIGQTGSGDCATCHTDGFDAEHAAYIHTVALGSGDLTDGVSCGACHVVATWAEIDGIEHNVPTNGAGSCATCHSSTRQEVIDAITLGANPTHCLPCHSSKNVTHGSVDHVALGYVTAGPATCATCHDPAGADATVSVTHLDNCALCHTTVPALLPGLVAGDCAACHGGTWEAEHTPALDHTALVTVGTTGCADCHDDTLVSVSADTHNACTSCHDTDGGLVSTAVGTDFVTGGDCITCHTNPWETDHPTTAFNHGNLVTVGTTGCADCHTDTLVSADAETHNACTSCHDAGSGALIGSAIGQTGSGDCTTCHAGTWDALHPTTTFDHSGLVNVGLTACASCHDNTLISASTETHNACASCHDATTGALIGSAIGQTGLGDCTTCHSGTWEAEHTPAVSHNALVQVGATDCVSCHNNPPPLVDAADLTNHNTCGSCHDTDGGLVSTAVGTTFAAGGDCATCHGSAWDALHPTTNFNHGNLVTVGTTGCADCHTDTLVSADAETHNACTSCHDAGSGALIGSAIGQTGSGDCTTCHAGTWDALHPTTTFDHSGLVNVGLTACASCHDNTLISASTETHNACASCHDATTGALIGSAIGQTGLGDCTTCHSGTWEAEHTPAVSHNALVQVGATDCVSCHNNPPPLVDAADLTNHNTCGSCHDTDGGLVSTAVGTTFAAGGDCATCHGSAWDALHPTTAFNHGNLVTVGATGCADCHTDTLVSADAETHNACTSCHDAGSGALIGSAIGQTGSGDCTTCHTGTWQADHPTTAYDHGGIVTVSGTSCGSCHDDTLVSAAPETHNACVSCHDVNTGVLIGSAVGQSGSGNCATCHSGGFDAEHATYAHTVALGAADLSSGISCGNCHTSANWTEIDTKHNVDTNGAGSCATCHNSARQEVIDTIALGANPTNCLPCHSNESVAHADHVAAGYVTVGGVQDVYGTTCASCHDPGGASDATVAVTHNGDCALCHTTIPNLQPGIPAGGGDCVACHSTSQHTLWKRYSAQSCGTAACHDMNGGPGNPMHDLHNPVGGWSDRNAATSGMTFPYATNPEMWQTNWPLTPECATCHTSFDDDTSGAGCNPCHAFKDGNKKGELHDRHAGKNGFANSNCNACHK